MHWTMTQYFWRAGGALRTGARRQHHRDAGATDAELKPAQETLRTLTGVLACV